MDNKDKQSEQNKHLKVIPGHEQAKLECNVHMRLIGSDGKVKTTRDVRNLIVDAGFDAVIRQILGSGSSDIQPTEFNYVAIGDDNTAVQASDTALANELGTRVQDTIPDFPSTGVGKLISTFAAGNGTGTLVETGVFNASSSGTMLARVTFAAVTKGVDDDFEVTWQFTQA